MISTEWSQVSHRLLKEEKYPCLFVGPLWTNRAGMVASYSSPKFLRLRSAEIIIFFGKMERFSASECRMFKFLQIMFDLDGRRGSYVVCFPCNFLSLSFFLSFFPALFFLNSFCAFFHVQPDMYFEYSFNLPSRVWSLKQTMRSILPVTEISP